MLVFVGKEHIKKGRRDAVGNPVALAINELLKPGLTCGIIYCFEIWSKLERLHVANLQAKYSAPITEFILNGTTCEFIIEIDIPKQYLREGVAT